MIDVILAFMIILAFLLAIALHELSHALVASLLGDTSPKQEGRQTLAFSSHVDALGLLMCIVLAFQVIALSPVGLGWGKPVKPDPWKMHVKNPDLGVFLVAITGPLFSLALGLVTTVIIGFTAPFLTNAFTERVLQFLVVFASVNIALAILNILPLYPLDGYQMLYTVLPGKQALGFARSAKYGPFIILGIFFLLPFIGNLTHASSFPLFHLSAYIWLGTMKLIGVILGPSAFDWLVSVYIL